MNLVIEDKKIEMESITSLLAAGTISVNDARGYLGYPPINTNGSMPSTFEMYPVTIGGASGGVVGTTTTIPITNTPAMYPPVTLPVSPVPPDQWERMLRFLRAPAPSPLWDEEGIRELLAATGASRPKPKEEPEPEILPLDAKRRIRLEEE